MSFFGSIVGMLILVMMWDTYGGKRELKNADKKDTGLYVFIDPDTKIHYFKTHPFDRLTMRVNTDGTPYTGEQND